MVPRPDQLRWSDGCPLVKAPPRLHVVCWIVPSPSGSSGEAGEAGEANEATWRPSSMLEVDPLRLRRDLGKPVLFGSGAGSSSSLESTNRLWKSEGPLSSSSSLESANRLAPFDFLPSPIPGDFLRPPLFKRELEDAGRSRSDWRIRPVPPPVVDGIWRGGDEKEFPLKLDGERERRLKRLDGVKGEEGSRKLDLIDIRP